jgi:DNA-binding NtrC family response regulator
MSFSIFKRHTNAGPSRTEVLLIGSDDRFYSSLLYVMGQTSWRLRWAKSVEAGTDSLTRHCAPVVVYDCRAAVRGWEIGLLTLALHSCRPSIILAVQYLDEAVWRRALRWGAYDVVSRKGDHKQLFVTMRFALEHKIQTTASNAEDGRLALASPTF